MSLFNKKIIIIIGALLPNIGECKNTPAYYHLHLLLLKCLIFTNQELALLSSRYGIIVVPLSLDNKIEINVAQ
jgi:hypothetical protein